MADFSLHPQFLSVLKNDLSSLSDWIASGGSVHSTEPFNHTTLLIQAAYNGFTNIINYLISMGASVNQVDKFNQTPLMHAALAGRASTCKLLLDNSADMNVVSDNKNTALSIAIAHNRLGVVEFLEYWIRQKELEKNAGTQPDAVLDPATEVFLGIITDEVQYLSIKDLTERFCREEGLRILVKSIMKIDSPHQKKYQQFRRSMVNPDRVVTKFYGNSGKMINKIILEGFSLSSQINNCILGRFGEGIYFCTESSKAIFHSIGTQKKTNLTNPESPNPLGTTIFLLLCEVAIGKFWSLNCSMPHLNYEEVRNLGYDSIYAERGTLEKGGVEMDEFVVYHKDQAIPLFLITLQVYD